VTASKLRYVITTMVLPLLGFVLIGIAQTFRFEWQKVQLDRLVAETGALFLIVGVLHWLFELGLREEMIREVAATTVGSTLLHDSGLEGCHINSRKMDESIHWERSPTLIVGRQYSVSFFKDHFEVLKRRCAQGLPTTITVLSAEGAAARYLEDSKTGNPDIKESVQEIGDLVEEMDGGKKKVVRLLFHDRVLRYSFLRSNESIWITFFTNSPERAMVPAFKIRAGTPLFDFFAEDIDRLLEHSSELKRSTHSS
jgi:hypothetical protein